MPRVYVPGKKLKPLADKSEHTDPVSIKLAGDIHHYLTRVLRLRPSDPVTLFDGERIEAFGRIIASDRRAVTVEVDAARTIEPQTFPELVLICAMLKRPKMDLVIQKATELSTDTIVPVHFARSVPKLDPTRTKNRLARWKKIAKSAAGQCGRINIPGSMLRRPTFPPPSVVPRVNPRRRTGGWCSGSSARNPPCPTPRPTTSAAVNASW